MPWEHNNKAKSTEDDAERMEGDGPWLWTQISLKNAEMQILDNGGNDENRT